MDLEMVLGPYPLDNPSGRWFTSKTKDSFVRFHDTGIRQVVYKTDEGWQWAIARDNPTKFQRFGEAHTSTRLAKEYPEGFDMFELAEVEQIVERWRE